MRVATVKGTKAVAHIAEDVNNMHILEVGPSGSGKSVAGSILIRNAALEGAAVIGISMNRAVTIPKDSARIKVIPIKEHGLPVPVLSSTREKKPTYNEISNASDALCVVSPLRVRQKKALKDAMKRASISDLWLKNEFMAIGIELQRSGEEIDESVYAHFEQLFETVLVYEDESLNLGDPGLIIIFELDGYSLDIQRQLARYILARIWQEACSVNRKFLNRWLILLDEFQDLGLKPDSVLYQIIREGRKFNVGAIMATQTLECFSKSERALLMQASTKLFFKPEPHEINRLLRDIGRQGEEGMSKRLGHLQKGECLAVGRYSVGTGVIEHPITLDFN